MHEILRVIGPIISGYSRSPTSQKGDEMKFLKIVLITAFLVAVSQSYAKDDLQKVQKQKQNNQEIVDSELIKNLDQDFLK